LLAVIRASDKAPRHQTANGCERHWDDQNLIAGNLDTKQLDARNAYESGRRSLTTF
jgi:hypothetical protein